MENLTECLNNLAIGDLGEKKLAKRSRKMQVWFTSFKNGGSTTASSTLPLSDSGKMSGSSRS
jgi:hypothetical protein